MTTASADGVKLGMMLQDKFRIPNDFVEVEKYSAKAGYHSVMRTNTLRQEQSFI